MNATLRARDAGLACGVLPPGARNSIADVPGVRVGHRTLRDGDIRTGVTAVVPPGGNLYREKPVAAVHVLNGFGKSTGLVQVEELGTHADLLEKNGRYAQLFKLQAAGFVD